MRDTGTWPIVEVYLTHGSFNRRNLLKAIRKVERELGLIERYRARGLFYSEEDYRHVKGIGMLYHRLYNLLLRVLEGLERGEDVIRLPIRSRLPRRVLLKRIRYTLHHRGIPYLIRNDEVLIPREFCMKYRLDYSDIIFKALIDLN